MASGPAIARGGTTGMERRSGVALWRQIADRIRQGLSTDLANDAGRLPPETDLAARFSVNRHTVRRAIAALIDEGVLRAEQGRGTFVEKRRRLSYPIGARTRFSAGLADQTMQRHSLLLDHACEPATAKVAEALGISEGLPVIRLETLSQADGRPVSRARSYFDAFRFAGIAQAYRESGSITASFRRLGLDDYFRESTVVSARHADARDLDDLKLSPGAIVLVTIAVNVDPAGRPVQYSQTRFAADRVELSVAREDYAPLPAGPVTPK